MKNQFSSGKSKRNHYNWFCGGEKRNPGKVTTYKLTEEELQALREKSPSSTKQT